jgi:Ca2+/Na+ antiporter
MKPNLRDINLLLGGVFISSIFYMINDVSAFLLSVVLFAYFIAVLALYFRSKKEKKRLKVKKTKEQKAIEKLKNSKAKEKKRKHDLIHNQVAYISEIWELSKSQERAFVNFIEAKVYTDLYSKMTSSLLPQLTKMIEECLEREKRGCKREVQRRINDLVAIIKSETKRKKAQKRENFETMSEVFDKLLKEIEK